MPDVAQQPTQLVSYCSERKSVTVQCAITDLLFSPVKFPSVFFPHCIFTLTPTMLNLDPSLSVYVYSSVPLLCSLQHLFSYTVSYMSFDLSILLPTVIALKSF